MNVSHQYAIAGLEDASVSIYTLNYNIHPERIKVFWKMSVLPFYFYLILSSEWRVRLSLSLLSLLTCWYHHIKLISLLMIGHAGHVIWDLLYGTYFMGDVLSPKVNSNSSYFRVRSGNGTELFKVNGTFDKVINLAIEVDVSQIEPNKLLFLYLTLTSISWLIIISLDPEVHWKVSSHFQPIISITVFEFH